MVLSKEIHGSLRGKAPLQIREENFTFPSQKLELRGWVQRIDERTRKQQVAAIRTRIVEMLGGLPRT
jgi:hypothetical protein